MPFRPPRKQPQFADLKGILAQSPIKDNALYQTVQEIIERLTQMKDVTQEQIADINNSINTSATEITNIVPPTGAGAGFWTPLTDGDVDETHLIFSLGECIMVFVPTP